MIKGKVEKVKTVFAFVGAALLTYGGILMIFGDRAVPTAFAQQGDVFLSRRVDQMEQRFYSIESRLNRLEQDSRLSSSTTTSTRVPTGNNDVELQYLRSELDGLRLRVGETECGLLKVDERTLTPAARQARKKTVASEVCRMNPGSPVELSSRP